MPMQLTMESLMTKACKCGCGEQIKGNRVFVNKEHQLAWLNAGGARELNAMLPEEVRVRGGKTAGRISVESGHLHEARPLSVIRVREITAKFRKNLKTSEDDQVLQH
jgi:hypothetical protein